jgi:tetratricopeptide (TPR) repeat protein
MMTNDDLPQELADKAKKSYQGGNYLEAAQIFSDASVAYDKRGDTLLSVEMKNNQSVALLRAQRPQAAFDAVKGTEEIFTQAGDSRRQGIALANQAAALESLKRFMEAIDYYQRAADAFEKADEGDLRADVMQLLAMLYLRHFKFYDAVITLQSGMAGAKNLTSKQRFMKKILSLHR